jgi:hypothetical protein
MRINRSLITYLPTSGAGSGTVTSVALTASTPTGLSATITGSPITAAGTINLSLAFAAGYAIPTTIQIGNWDTAYNFVNAFPTGSASQLLRYNTLGTALEFFTPSYLVSINATAPLVYNSGTNTLSIPLANGTNDGYLSSADWLTFSSKQAAITLTTVGDNGPSTFNGVTGALNIPEYTLVGLGGMSNPFSALGEMLYSNAAGAPVVVNPNTTTTKKFLSMTGTGTTGAAPQWSVISGSIISDGFQIDYDSNVSGLRDSSNKVFTVSVNFVSGSTRVFVNGLRYSNGLSYDYTETGTNQITFTNAPDNGDLIIVEYLKA